MSLKEMLLNYLNNEEAINRPDGPHDDGNDDKL